MGRYEPTMVQSFVDSVPVDNDSRPTAFHPQLAILRHACSKHSKYVTGNRYWNVTFHIPRRKRTKKRQQSDEKKERPCWKEKQNKQEIRRMISRQRSFISIRETKTIWWISYYVCWCLL